MAIYHMQAKVVSRGSGRSAVAASAYMSCSRMYNDYDGIQHDYTRKQGLIYQEVMLPPMAPLEWNDREQLWNAVEETEKTKDSRLAREFVVALPVELDKDSNISLLQDFIKKNFVDIRFRFLIKVDNLSVASAFKVEYTVVIPAVFVITDEKSLRVC